MKPPSKTTATPKNNKPNPFEPCFLNIFKPYKTTTAKAHATVMASQSPSSEITITPHLTHSKRKAITKEQQGRRKTQVYNLETGEKPP